METMEPTEFDKNREAFDRIKEKSEDDFEKLITYLSAGALALSLTYIEKILPLANATAICFLILGWISLASSLIINLASHLYSVMLNSKSIEDLVQEHPDIIPRIKKRNERITRINILTLIAFLVGVFSIVIFTSINTMSMTKSDKHNASSPFEKYEEKGRQIPLPKQSNPKTKSDGQKK